MPDTGDRDGATLQTLCDHPVVRAAHRFFVMLAVPALCWTALTFVEMRDAQIETGKDIAAIAKDVDRIVRTQEDIRRRLRQLEARDGPARPWGEL